MRSDEGEVVAVIAVLVLVALLSAVMGDCAGEKRGVKMGECNATIAAAKTPSDTLRWMAMGCKP